MLYSINYDLKQPGRDYSGLYAAIKNLGVWWHYLDSTWLVDTHLRADGIWNSLKAHVDSNDSILIVGITTDWSGWLDKKAWEWIRERQRSAA